MARNGKPFTHVGMDLGQNSGTLRRGALAGASNWDDKLIH
jgi:hypothetical protein